MPDNNGSNALSGLYPQPPVQQGGNALLNNPLAVIGAMNSINALAQFHGRQGAAQAGIAALRPDGSLDAGKYVQGLQADPSIAAGGQEVIGSMLDQRGKDIANATGRFNLEAAENQSVQNLLGSLNHPGVTMEEVMNAAVTHSRNHPEIPSSVYTGWLQGLPRQGGAPLQRAIGLHQNMSLGAAGTATRVPGPAGPQGEQSSIPLGQANLIGTQAPARSAAPGAPAPPPAPGGAPNGAIYTTPPAGLTEAKQVAGAESGKQLAQDRISAANYKNEIYPLEKAIPALERLGTTGTGPGTETLNDINSFLISQGIIKPTQAVKDFDTARKSLTEYVNRNGNTTSNDKMVASFAGSPSVNISHAAALDLSKVALSLRNMKHAQLRQFQQTGLPENQYADWASKWVTTQDPIAYGVSYMTDDAKAKLKAYFSTRPEEKKKFTDSLRAAHASEVVSPPNAQ